MNFELTTWDRNAVSLPFYELISGQVLLVSSFTFLKNYLP